jgi:hypothetical protein
MAFAKQRAEALLITPACLLKCPVGLEVGTTRLPFSGLPAPLKSI